MIITVTGTPGAGKTFAAKRIARIMHARYFDLNAFIKKERLYDAYNSSLRTYDVDTRKLSRLSAILFSAYSSTGRKLRLKKKEYTLRALLAELSQHSWHHTEAQDIIIDSHLSHTIASDLCIVIRRDIALLAKEYRKRKYPAQKIRDNLESEIFQICLDEARTVQRNVIVAHNP